MAPEQFRGAAQPESDLYGLGGTLVYLLSGRPPSDFPLNRMKVDTSTVPMNYKLRRVVDGLLEPVVEDRLTADEALRILRGEELVHKNFIGGNLFASPNLRGSADSNDYEVAMLQDTPEFGKFSRYCGDIQVTVSRSKSSLVIDIPPAPLGGSLYNGAFAIGWNSFVAFWTISAFASGGIFFALFSLPFWVAGVSLQRQAFKRAFVRERLEITDSNWSLRVRLAPLPWKSTEKDWESDASQTFSGDKRRSLTAEVRETGIVNGERQGHLVLNQGNEQFIVGEGLDLRGQYWLCEIINRHLEASRASMHLPAVNESSSDSIP